MKIPTNYKIVSSSTRSDAKTSSKNNRFSAKRQAAIQGCLALKLDEGPSFESLLIEEFKAQPISSNSFRSREAIPASGTNQYEIEYKAIQALDRYWA